MIKYLKLLRVEQWVKNFFVFIPLFFSGNITHPNFFVKSVFAFIVFSLIASSIYILNDYKDIEADQKHPEKKDRPLANGSISKTTALFLFTTLISAVAMLVFFGQEYFHKNLWKFAVIIGS